MVLYRRKQRDPGNHTFNWNLTIFLAHKIYYFIVIVAPTMVTDRVAVLRSETRWGLKHATTDSHRCRSLLSSSFDGKMTLQEPFSITYQKLTVVGKGRNIARQGKVGLHMITWKASPIQTSAGGAITALYLANGLGLAPADAKIISQ